jgi:beta-mannosidase
MVNIFQINNFKGGGSMNRLQKVGWFIGVLAIVAWAQQETEVTAWKMQDSATVGATAGTTISTSSYSTSSWYTATVPGTVLNTFWNQNVYPDPHYGENMLNIPDLASEQKRYWFQGTFPAVSFASGQRVWLELGGINYKAWLYLNGHYLDTMYGAFREKKIDVTQYVSSTGTNYIAVKIQGNFNPGTYHDKESGNCGSNGGVMSQDGPTFIASQGWDWIPTVADRDMGIWKPVYVRVTGSVELRHPWVRTLNVSTTSATIPVQVTLMNTSGASVSGTLSGVIDNTIQLTPQSVTVPGTAPDSVIATFPDYTMTNPTLWWPNGYGNPILHTLELSFTPTGGTVSDTLMLKFGVREYAYTTTPSLTITCNGTNILCRGGNWGMDDMMKTFDLHKLENKVRYHKEMNFNIVRDWIGMTDCEPFYALCDSFGIMVWSDFWEPHSADQPVPVGDQTNYIANMGDKIMRARNHASVVLWCERNETTPTPAFLTALDNYETTLDGTRYVQPSSGQDGAHSGGPYTWTAIQDVYGAISGFHTEFGGPHVMSYESMAATFPTADLFPMGNDWWSFHDYCSGNGDPANYTSAMTTTWGTATDIHDCTKKAQLMNYDEARASEETITAKAFNGVTGLLLWMSNCVWPSLMWQSYDYYMEGTGGYFGFQKGSESIHAQYYAAASSQIMVFNNSVNAISNYSLTSSTYNVNGTQAWTNTKTGINVAAGGSASIVTPTAGASTPYFLDLKLRNASGSLVSHNFYWEPSDGSDISAMLDSTTLKMVSVTQTPNPTWTLNGVENTISLNIVNPTSNTVPAVFCRLMLTQNAVGGTRILPIHFNDNYFSLLPGDTQVVTVKFDEVDRAGQQPVLSLTGINVRPITFTLPTPPYTSVRRSSDNNAGMSGFSAKFVGDNLRLNNIAAGSDWEVKLFDMQGRVLLNVHGAKGQNAVVSLARIHPGAYLAVAKCAGKTASTMLTIAK